MKQFPPLLMPQSMIKQREDRSIKEGHNEDPILINRNGKTLEVYEYDSNTHAVTTGLDNNYNKYNSNNVAYEDGANN